MFNIKLYRDVEGKLKFESSNHGKLVDISNELRAKAIPFKRLMKNGKEVKKNFFLCKDQLIMDLTKKEDKSVDALYYKYNENSILIVPETCITIFDI